MRLTRQYVLFSFLSSLFLFLHDGKKSAVCSLRSIRRVRAAQAPRNGNLEPRSRQQSPFLLGPTAAANPEFSIGSRKLWTPRKSAEPSARRMCSQRCSRDGYGRSDFTDATDM